MNATPKVLLAHPGTQHAIQLANQLEKMGLLHEFWTPAIIAEESRTYRFFKTLLPQSALKKISNRLVKEINPKKLKTMFLFELRYLLKSRKGFTEEIIYQRNKEFQLSIPDDSIQSADVIVGFDTSSWILAQRAKKFGKKFILDVSIAHPNAKIEIFKKLSLLFPDWSEELKSKSETLIKFEEEEFAAADYVVTASTFTKNSLCANNVDENKIVVNPYGVDLTKFSPKSLPTTDQKIKFLFLGSLTARKGIVLLVDTWKAIAPQQAELLLIGPANQKILNYIQNQDTITYLGKIPHKDLQNYLKQCDVLVFPSFFEGFGLVILEAMASGMAVITTDATAGADLIENNVDGILYSSFNTEELRLTLLNLINDPEKIKDLGNKARTKALKFTWNAYAERWATLLSTLYTN